MNIKQAKARFTELTGLPATKAGSIQSFSNYSAVYIIDYISRNTPLEYGLKAHDRRRTGYWVSLVKAIESYMEVA